MTSSTEVSSKGKCSKIKIILLASQISYQEKHLCKRDKKSQYLINQYKRGLSILEVRTNRVL